MAWQGPRLTVALAAVALGLLGTRPAWAEDTQTPRVKSWYLSVTNALPLAVGGLVGLELHRRFDDRSFVRLGGGTSFLLSGAYVSYGRVLTANDFFVVAGLDANLLVVPFSGPQYWPGIHAGGGWEWFNHWTRTALSFEVGYPWLLGARFSVGL